MLSSVTFATHILIVLSCKRRLVLPNTKYYHKNGANCIFA